MILTLNRGFWLAVDELVGASQVIIDRPAGSHHPRYLAIVYPVDYGYLSNTTSMDKNGIDVWVGSASPRTIDAVICTVDLVKRDSEVKILLGCTAEERILIYDFHNQSENMKGLLIARPLEAP